MMIYALAVAGASGAAAIAHRFLRGRSTDAPAPTAEATRCFILCERGEASAVRNRIFSATAEHPLNVLSMSVGGSQRDGAVALTVDLDAQSDATVTRFISQLVSQGGVVTVQRTPISRRSANTRASLSRHSENTRAAIARHSAFA